MQMINKLGSRLLDTLLRGVEAGAQGCYWEYYCARPSGIGTRYRRRCCSDNTHPPSCGAWEPIGAC